MRGKLKKPVQRQIENSTLLVIAANWAMAQECKAFLQAVGGYDCWEKEYLNSVATNVIRTKISFCLSGRHWDAFVDQDQEPRTTIWLISISQTTSQLGHCCWPCSSVFSHLTKKNIKYFTYLLNNNGQFVTTYCILYEVKFVFMACRIVPCLELINYIWFGEINMQKSISRK